MSGEAAVADMSTSLSTAASSGNFTSWISADSGSGSVYASASVVAAAIVSAKFALKCPCAIFVNMTVTLVSVIFTSCLLYFD